MRFFFIYEKDFQAKTKGEKPRKNFGKYWKKPIGEEATSVHIH